MAVTIRDIAKRLGVSAGTVSKGLNGAKDISESMRKQILDTAVEMGYTTRRQKKSDEHRLALFIENMRYDDETSFGYDIVLGFEQAASQESWPVDVIPVSPAYQTENQYDHVMIEGNYIAGYLVGFSRDDPWMEQLLKTPFPTVLLDNYIDNNNRRLCSLSTDNEEAMNLMISHLIGLGHEKIAFLDGSTGSLVSDLRMKYYLSTMRRYHLPVNPNMAVYGYFVADAAHYHVPNFVNMGATAILCGSDDIARGVIDSLHEMGLRIPEDVSVIGFDDMPFAKDLHPALTTIRQDRLALGRAAAYSIKAMLDDCALSRPLLRPELVVRSSTGIAKPRLVTSTIEEKDSVLHVNPSLYEQIMR